MKTSLRIYSTLSLLAVCACSVRTTAPETEAITSPNKPGRTSAPESDSDTAAPESSGTIDAGALDSGEVGDAGEADGAALERDASEAERTPPRADVPRARGFYVFNLDYNNSLSIGAIGVDGSIQSRSLLSSGSDVPGLSLPLGSDAVPASQVQSGDTLVIVDRTNNAIDWLSMSARVTNQIGVGPGGFAANPYDYVQLTSELGFVSRYATNGAPGNAKLDQGGDLLAINPKTKKLLGRVDFNSLTKKVADLDPRPTKLLAYDGGVYVVLGMLSASTFAPLVDSVLARVDPSTLEVTATLELGLRNCEDMDIAPQGGLLAIACHGAWDDDPLTAHSGIVVVDVANREPQIAATYGAAELADAQISTLAFASETQLLFSSYGSTYPTAIPDRAYSLDLTNGTVSEPVMEASAFQLGHIRCAAEQNVCVLANADTFAVEFFTVEDTGVEHDQTVEFDANLGLPPRYIGVY